MNLVLIGARCSGKTTVGRLVAAQLGRPFVDLDDRVCATFHQRSITTIWREYGEPAWREAELRCLRIVLAQNRQVVALGGGTPMIDGAAELLDSQRQIVHARVVYLACSAVELERRRLEFPGDDRPALANESLTEEIARTWRERSATYAALADLTLDASHMTADEAAGRLVLWFDAVEN